MQYGKMWMKKDFNFYLFLVIFFTVFFIGSVTGNEITQELISSNETTLQANGQSVNALNEEILSTPPSQITKTEEIDNHVIGTLEIPSSGTVDLGDNIPLPGSDPSSGHIISETLPSPIQTIILINETTLIPSLVTATVTNKPPNQDVEMLCPQCGGKKEEKLDDPPVDSLAFHQKKQKELEDVQVAIKGKNKKWMAGNTSVSDLSDEEFIKMLGVKPKSLSASPDGATASNDSIRQSSATILGLPPSIDWRNNGGDFTTPIRNQRDCGSCWAFASLGTFESRLEIASNNPNLNPDFAEQDLVSCAGCGGCSGASMDCPLNWVLNQGTMNETCYPYTARDTSCSPGCSRSNRISGWHRIYPLFDENAIKDTLTRGPVIGTFAVYQDFSYYTGGIYEYAWGSLRGYHAIVIVGWGQDETGTYWICKNSWGTNWGETGWFKIRSGNCGINDELYELSVTPPTPQVNFTVTPATGVKPLVVNFQDGSSNSPTSWQWNFGDLTPNSTLQNPNHTYSTTGNYTVTLTVSNSYGSSTLQKTNYIQVVNPPEFLSG
ncbi:MAG: C1 family peptidase, partial [Methanolinea sp.]